MDPLATVRAFNRFYTRLVGALDPRFLGTDLTLAEARLLFEIAHADRPLASDLLGPLGMDAGFGSRVLRRFEARGWITRDRGAEDGRQRPISLTPEGRAAFADLDRRQRDAVVGLIDSIAPEARADLVAALGTAQALLAAPSRRP